MSHPSDKELDASVARMLMIGVSIAALVVFAGGILLLRQPLIPIPDYTHFHAVDPSLRSLKGITGSAFHLNPRAIVQFYCLKLRPQSSACDVQWGETHAGSSSTQTSRICCCRRCCLCVCGPHSHPWSPSKRTAFKTVASAECACVPRSCYSLFELGSR